MSLTQEECAAIGRFWWRAMCNSIKYRDNPKVIYLLNAEWLKYNDMIKEGKYHG